VGSKFAAENATEAVAAVADNCELPGELFFPSASFAGGFPIKNPDKLGSGESTSGEEASALVEACLSLSVVFARCIANAAAKPKPGVGGPKIPAIAAEPPVPETANSMPIVIPASSRWL
jgi:hypothetical protein